VRCAILAPAALAFAAACSSGQPATSPGTVTLRLLLPQGQAFCDVFEGCSGVTHVVVGRESGNWLPSNPGPCGGIECSSSCAPGTCNAGACPPAGIALSLPVTNVEMTWEGSYVDWSACGGGTRCYIPRFVPAGRYVARLCATPGTTSADGITCMQTGPQECVETTFDLPGPSPVEVPLRN